MPEWHQRKMTLQSKYHFQGHWTQTLGLKCRVDMFCSRGAVQWGEIPALKQYFSHYCAPESPGMLFTRQNPESDFWELPAQWVEVGLEFAFLTNSQVGSALPVWSLISEKHCLKETRQETGWNLIKIMKSSWKLASFHFCLLLLFLFLHFASENTKLKRAMIHTTDTLWVSNVY